MRNLLLSGAVVLLSALLYVRLRARSKRAQRVLPPLRLALPRIVEDEETGRRPLFFPKKGSAKRPLDLG